MTYKQKLIDLLKSDDEVKSVMEKLEFGCRILIKNNFYKQYENCYFDRLIETKEEVENKIQTFISWGEAGINGPYINTTDKDNLIIDEDIKIIGLPLQERFIRMYCENKGIYICITTSGFICGLDIDKPYCRLDNTKDFDNQSEEVYQKIYEALININ